MNCDYLNEVGKDRTYFLVPRGECDRELCEAVMDGSINNFKDCGGKWLVSVPTEQIKWED